MKRLKLMADYQCYPLWNLTDGCYGDVAPSDLPISEDLQSNLLKWAAVFDEILNWDDPASSNFESEEAEDEFKLEAYRLKDRLVQELGSDYSIEVKV